MIVNISFVVQGPNDDSRPLARRSLGRGAVLYRGEMRPDGRSEDEEQLARLTRLQFIEGTKNARGEPYDGGPLFLIDLAKNKIFHNVK